jgi:hypothetical protein
VGLSRFSPALAANPHDGDNDRGADSLARELWDGDRCRDPGSGCGIAVAAPSLRYGMP